MASQIALLRCTYGFALYRVDTVTAQRFYGEKILGDWVGKFAQRNALLKMDATREDYTAVLKWKHDKEQALAAVRVEWEAKFNAMFAPRVSERVGGGSQESQP